MSRLTETQRLRIRNTLLADPDLELDSTMSTGISHVVARVVAELLEEARSEAWDEGYKEGEDDALHHEEYVSTNPHQSVPNETACPTCGATYMWHVEYRYTCPNGHHWSAPTDGGVTS